jgi:predicted nucleic acid-binding protein
MLRTIISDTSCFIVLEKINELDLLYKIYGQIITTNEVASEYGQPLPDWIIIKETSDKYRKQILGFQLDKGEASVIELAIETPGSTIILDDLKARTVAQKLGIEITGTIGVIVKAKQNGVISSIKPYLDKIRKNGFHLTVEIEKQALLIAGE